ncbi:MAG: hypothetical protein RR320_07745, partial [Oscillospiraceae bacterium]
YPKKKAKTEARKAWKQVGGDGIIDMLLPILATQSQGADWKRENYRYAPHPASWLRGRRWEDEEGDATNEATVEPDLPAF